MFGAQEKGYAALPSSHADLEKHSSKRPAAPRKIKRFIFATALLLIVVASLDRFRRRTPSQCPPAWESETALLCHHNAARAKFELHLQRQSRTPQQAIVRYRTKYNREPPAGFDDWAAFALQHGSPIIDDFDQLEADLMPFRSIDPAVLKARVDSAARHIEQVGRFSIRDGTLSLQVKRDHLKTIVTFIEDILEPVTEFLPDVDLLFNWEDVGYVYGPTERLTEANTRDAYWTTFSAKDAWDRFRAPCPRSTIAESPIAADRPTVNTCALEESAHDRHGLFNSHMPAINTTLPVISLSKLSTLQDITAPAWCYGTSNYRRTPADELIPFDAKKSQVYWRGTNTGLNPKDFRVPFNGHRQRILLWIAQLQDTLTTRTGGQPKSRPTSSIANVPLRQLTNAQEQALSRLPASVFDVGFTHYAACTPELEQAEPEKCAQYAALFPIRPGQPSWNAAQYKYLLDLDGNAMSCRYYRLLEMGSVVFKQTVWSEWHDDRMVPFLHYIPLDLSADTLPLYIDLLENTEHGRQIARTVAESGRLWAETGLRQIDISIAYYRLLLEMAHIMG